MDSPLGWWPLAIHTFWLCEVMELLFHGCNAVFHWQHFVFNIHKGGTPSLDSLETEHLSGNTNLCLLTWEFSVGRPLNVLLLDTPTISFSQTTTSLPAGETTTTVSSLENSGQPIYMILCFQVHLEDQLIVPSPFQR